MDIKHSPIDSDSTNHHYGPTGASGNDSTEGSGDSLEGMTMGAPSATENPKPHGSTSGSGE